MSLYETQEPLEDDIQEHALGFARHVDIAQADAAAQPSVTGSSPNFHVFYHAYNELYRRSCELLQFAQSRGINDGAGLIGSVTDELQNQKSCLSAFDDYLKNVWVQIYLDDSARLQVSQMMSIQTTIQGLFSQLPELVQNLLEVVLHNSPPLASDFQLRLICDFPDVISSSGHNFDIPVHSSITLEQIMHEYIPGTFQLSFRLLYQGEPVNLAALILDQLTKSFHEDTAAAMPVHPRSKAAPQTPGQPQAQHWHSPLQAEGNLNGQGKCIRPEPRGVSVARPSASPRMPRTDNKSISKKLRLHQQEVDVATHPQKQNKPLSAKQLLSSGLVLNLQRWDHVAKTCLERQRAGHAAAAEDLAEVPHIAGASGAPGISPNNHTETHPKVALHSKSENRISGPDTHHHASPSTGRGRKRQRVRSASVSPAAVPAAARADPVMRGGQTSGQPQLPPHMVRSPVGPTPDSAPRFQWKVEDVTLLLKGIQQYGKQWSTIQSQLFRAHPGTSFQSKMKDKWRSLCQVIEKKHAARKSLPEHLWKQVESLKKLHGMQ